MMKPVFVCERHKTTFSPSLFLSLSPSVYVCEEGNLLEIYCQTYSNELIYKIQIFRTIHKKIIILEIN